MASVTSVVSCFILLLAINIQKYLVQRNKQDYDLRTRVISDYTMVISFSNDEAKKLVEKAREEGTQGESKGYRLKEILIKKIEFLLTAWHVPREEARVADLNLHFHNSEVIDLLKKRGTHIRAGDDVKTKSVIRELQNHVQDNYEELSLPFAAFVTLETEKAYNAFRQHETINLFTQVPQKVVEPSEPTNIIWENIDFPSTSRSRRILCSVFIVVILLAMSFAATLLIKQSAKESFDKYDKSMKCETIGKVYSEDLMATLAADEWFDYYKGHG